MRLRFYIDPATGQPHIYNHDVSEAETEEIMDGPGDDFPARGESRIALGTTSSGRHLQVVYVPDPQPDSAFVVTAYDLRGKPLAAYRRRRRKA